MNGVELLIQRLKENDNLIAEAYYHGNIFQDDKNKLNVNILFQHKALIKRESQSYTVHLKLREFLDISLNKERLYRVNTDFAVLFERLVNLLNDLYDAYHDGYISKAENYESEIQYAINEIFETIHENISQLRYMTENHFGTATTFSEKKRQNEYYLNRTEKMVEAIGVFSQSEWMEYGGRIFTDNAFVNIAPTFRDQLQNKLSSFRQKLNDILEILKKYLYEFRQIEKQTSKLRKMWAYLERHPDYEFQNYSENPNPPLWLWKSIAIVARGYPEIRSEYAESLAEIAERIPQKKKHEVKVKRQRGAIAQNEPVEDIYLEKKPYQRFIEQMCTDCIHNNQPLSVRIWYQNHSDEMKAVGSIDVWLQSVLETFGHENVLYPNIIAKSTESIIPKWTGNILVEDVELYPIKSF